MRERPTERARALLDGLTAHAIVERVHPYYNGFQFEGEWLDATKGAICDELDEVDAKVPGTCHIEEHFGEWYCTGCGVMVGTRDPDSELCVDGNYVSMWNYCPNCGRLVERGDVR